MLTAMQKHPKRPRDPNQLGKLIVDLSVGEASEPVKEDKRDPAAVALGQKGGKARAKSLSVKRRKEIAKKAAELRWAAKIE
jgi:hypothetical protein